jgi:hypothetical protein
MLTHGSNCQRALSGPFVALAVISVVHGRRICGRHSADRTTPQFTAGEKLPPVAGLFLLIGRNHLAESSTDLLPRRFGMR